MRERGKRWWAPLREPRREALLPAAAAAAAYLRAYPVMWAGLLLAVAVGCIYWGGVVLDRQGCRAEYRKGKGCPAPMEVVAYIRCHSAPKSPTAGRCLSRLMVDRSCIAARRNGCQDQRHLFFYMVVDDTDFWFVYLSQMYLSHFLRT
uniref:Uncharacterized protein n=1 Tax=Oryza punctata TaxID=4537 RepID=A0A0E0L0J4_ORYPU